MPPSLSRQNCGPACPRLPPPGTLRHTLFLNSRTFFPSLSPSSVTKTRTQSPDVKRDVSSLLPHRHLPALSRTPGLATALLSALLPAPGPWPHHPLPITGRRTDVFVAGGVGRGVCWTQKVLNSFLYIGSSPSWGERSGRPRAKRRGPCRIAKGKTGERTTVPRTLQSSEVDGDTNAHLFMERTSEKDPAWTSSWYLK